MKCLRWFRNVVSIMLLMAPATGPYSAEPPQVVNYQGVLRDAAGVPLNGAYDMTFALFDASSGGNEILVDAHTYAHMSNVDVSNGLFSTTIGSGYMEDGSGPGVYTTLPQVFSAFGDVWLEVRVGPETLSPRTRFASAPFALNAGAVDGVDGSLLVNTTSAPQTKAGEMAFTIATSNTVVGIPTQGFHSYGTESGGHVFNGFSQNTWLARRLGPGSAGYGIESTGLFDGTQGGGGVFTDTATSATAYLASKNAGIDASGPQVGGHFTRTGTPAQAWLAGGNFSNYQWGIIAEGTSNGASSGGGGLFRDTFSGTAVQLCSGGYGVVGTSATFGGAFVNTTSNSVASLATPLYGVSGDGPTAGGWFHNTSGGSDTTIARRGTSGDNWGVYAQGNSAAVPGVGGGGYFYDGTSLASATLASAQLGVQGLGNQSGGFFRNPNTSAQAWVAGGSGGNPAWGIEAYGRFSTSWGWGGGGYFKDTLYGSYANVGSWDIGIDAWGPTAGGRFVDSNSSSYALVGYDIYKIVGVGTMSFVQNHPTDKDHVVVYAAPEGPESATYTRGSAKLQGGVARIALDPTFSLVTNPDIGLTAHVSPRGKKAGLYVESVTPETLVVRSDDPGSGDAAVDYLVYGLRIGFEEVSAVQEKQEEARIPSMAAQRALLSRRPDLSSFTPQGRFMEMRASMGESSPVDLRASRALHDAVQEFDSAVHGPVALAAASPLARRAVADPSPLPGPAADVASPAPRESSSPAANGPWERTPAGPQPLVPPGTRLEVSGAVAPGEVVVLDLAHPGRVHGGSRAADPAVAGVVVEGDAGPGHAFITTSGMVPCRVDAGYGAIRTGDLLTLSDTPGHAMRTLDPVPGTILGKAVDPLEAGTGTIRILVMLR